MLMLQRMTISGMQRVISYKYLIAVLLDSSLIHAQDVFPSLKLSMNYLAREI